MAPIVAALIGVVLPVLVSVVLIVMGASTPGEFLVVRISIALAALDVFVVTIWILYRHADAYWHFALGAAILAFLAIAIPKIFNWVDDKESIAWPPNSKRTARKSTRRKPFNNLDIEPQMSAPRKELNPEPGPMPLPPLPLSDDDKAEFGISDPWNGDELDADYGYPTDDADY